MKKNDATFKDLYLDEIEIEGARRSLDHDAVTRIAASMEEIGLQTPITVRLREDERGQAWVLVSGMHRLKAAEHLGWEKIRAVEKEWTPTEARKWEISENLHRSDLTPIERREHIAEWVRLTAEKVSHGGTPIAGGEQPAEKAIRKAARDLGIPKSTVARAVAAESLQAEVKAAADQAGLGTVKRAAIAREPTPEAQLATIKREREVAAQNAKAAPPVLRGKKGKPEPLAAEELAELVLAELGEGADRQQCIRATTDQRRFLSYATDIHDGIENLLDGIPPGHRRALVAAIGATAEQLLRELEKAEADDAQWDANHPEEAAARAEEERKYAERQRLVDEQRARRVAERRRLGAERAAATRAAKKAALPEPNAPAFDLQQ